MLNISKRFLISCLGLDGTPLFTSLVPSAVSNILSNWSNDAPPGGPGDCLVQHKGQLYNATCNQKSNFACEEMPAPDGITTTL
jgi:hypothetical protein